MEQSYGKMIKELRLKSFMTQKQLADKLFLTPQSISQYENNKRQISAELLTEILKVFGYDLSFIESYNNNEVFALHWDLSFFHDFSNEYGRIGTVFTGMIELDEKQYLDLSYLFLTRNFSSLSSTLEKLTSNIPFEHDIWDSESWDLFFEQCSFNTNLISVSASIDSEVFDDDYECYEQFSFVKLLKTPKNTILNYKPEFNRSIYLD